MKQILLTCKFLLSLLLIGALFAPAPARASGPIGDVIFNEMPFVPLQPPTSIANVVWNKFDHRGNSEGKLIKNYELRITN